MEGALNLGDLYCLKCSHLYLLLLFSRKLVHDQLGYASLSKLKLLDPRLKQLKCLIGNHACSVNMLGHLFPSKLKKDITWFVIPFAQIFGVQAV